MHGVRAMIYMVRPNAAELAEIARMIDDGIVKPVVTTVLPLAEARKVHEISQGGHATGKIVLEVTA